MAFKPSIESAMEETGEIEQAMVSGEGVEVLKQQLKDWRLQRKPGERIPAPLWAGAVDAAKEHGVYRVAIDLHLDYATLKRRIGDAGATTPRSRVAPRFVEVVSPAASPARSATATRHECVVELENARGAKMRVELNAAGVAALAGLCNAFWGA